MSLAQCLRKLTASAHPNLLIMLLDTLDRELWSFSALGDSRPLLWDFIQHYRKMRTKIAPHRAIVSRLTIIASKLGLGKDVVEYLERESHLCEPQSGLAAFTPVSDFMLDSTSTHVSALEEEIEMLAANAAAPDEQTFSRVFRISIEEFTDAIQPWPENKQHLVGPPLLHKLREINSVIFEHNITDWLHLTLPQAYTTRSQQVLVALLAGSYVSLPVLHVVTEHIFTELTRDCALRSRFANFMLSCMTHIIDVNLSLPPRVSEQSAGKSKPLLPHQDGYRFRTLQQHFCTAYPTTIVKLCLSTMHFSTTASLDIRTRHVHDWLQSNDVSSCFEICILNDPKSFLAQFDYRSSESVADTVPAIIRFLERLTSGDYHVMNTTLDGFNTNRSSLKTSMMEMFCQVNELSLPFFQVLLECVTAVRTLDGNEIENHQALVLECVKMRRDHAPFIWSRLFSGFNSLLGLQVCLSSSPELPVANGRARFYHIPKTLYCRKRPVPGLWITAF